MQQFLPLVAISPSSPCGASTAVSNCGYPRPTLPCLAGEDGASLGACAGEAGGHGPRSFCAAQELQYKHVKGLEKWKIDI